MPRKSHRQRSLVGSSPRGCKRHPPHTPSPNITSSNKSAPVPRGSNLIPSALSQHDVSGLLFFFFFLGLGGQVMPSQKAQYCLSQECSFGEFPGSPVVRTLCFYCSRPRSSPWSGNWDPASHTVWQKEKMQVLSQTDLGSNPGFLDGDDLGQVI